MCSMPAESLKEAIQGMNVRESMKSEFIEVTQRTNDIKRSDMQIVDEAKPVFTPPVHELREDDKSKSKGKESENPLKQYLDNLAEGESMISMPSMKED